MKWRLFFEPRDLWLGVYWTRDAAEYAFDGSPFRYEWRVYLCLVPMLPLLVTWTTVAWPARATMRVRP